VDRGKKILQIRDIEPGSEAEKAGLRWNDRILEINGTQAREEVLLSDPSVWMQDKRELDLLVQRTGSEKIRVHLKRSLLELENVESRMVRDLGTDLGYIRIRSFMDGNLDEKTLTAIERLEKAGARGLILDLRGNPGGLMDQAGKVASLFVGKKPITTERLLDADQHGIQNENSSQTVIGPYSVATRLPLAVLIDAGSASASEVVAGALQDHGRGWIIGDRTYGKGSMQQPVPFKTRYFDFTGKINLQVTFARFYRPSGGTTQIRGVTPNFEIDPRPHARPEEKIAFREEDSFMNPIQPEGEAWTETRMDEVRSILECRKKRDAEGLYLKIARSKPVQGPDFRLYAAEEILLCPGTTISATP
jgi:carboxyl-terminal processing protease